MTLNIAIMNNRRTTHRRGIVLLVTLVLLIVLSMLGYTLCSRLAARRHRDQYIIDYQAARYACDSATKYALAGLVEIESPALVVRADEPDFSDLFYYTDAEYAEYLAEWAAKKAAEKNAGDINDINDVNDVNDVNDISEFNNVTAADTLEDFNLGITDLNDFNEQNDVNEPNDFNEPNSLTVRGPYGPPWPFIIEPIELEIGSAKVKIEIEDENAKYPLGLALLEGEDVQREAETSLETFCEWMGMAVGEIDSLKGQLKEMGEIKPFKVTFEPIVERTSIEQPKARRSGRRGRENTRRTARQKTTTISAEQQMAQQSRDYAKLFHSSLIDTETLAVPTMGGESRKESTLKYTGIWASRQVNINTAPRHVLEAVFAFGGDADKIAEEIILRRRTSPFKDINDLRSSLLRYAASIEKCEKYITTTSSIFTIRITAVSGVAKASTVIGVIKDGKTVERIGVISG